MNQTQAATEIIWSVLLFEISKPNEPVHVIVKLVENRTKPNRFHTYRFNWIMYLNGAPQVKNKLLLRELVCIRWLFT